MNKAEQNKKERRPISDLVCGTISILFGLAMIKVFVNPFDLFFFVGVFFLVGGIEAGILRDYGFEYII